MKLLLAVICLSIISACSATPNGSLIPTGGPIAPSIKAHYSIADFISQAALSKGNRQPDVSAIKIHSIGVVATINGSKEDGYVPVTCTARDNGGVATGCGLYAKQTLRITKMIAGLFTGAKAKGCIAAVGKYHGTVQAGATIPIRFLWTGKC